MQRIGTPLLLLADLVIAFVIALNLLIYIETRAYIYSDPALVPSETVALVPGAALASPNTLSGVFTERVDLAIRLYEAKKVSKILVSGDNSTLAHNEVNPARTYLLAHGIPETDIFLDHAGFDTYSSLYRARDVFGVTSLIIATQSFHLPRAVFIARKLGIEAYGVPADNGPESPSNYIREIFADEKAIFDLALNRAPKYLGPAIPVTGDGRAYH